MLPEDRLRIRVRLLEKGITLAQIGRDLGIGRATICHVVAGRRRCYAVETRIAQCLGVSREFLFDPNRRTPRPKPPRRQRVA